VTSIEPSHFDPGTAYVSVDFHLADNRDPYIYKTADFGKTWTLIVGGLPKHPLAYVRVIAEDPNAKGLLFAGTGNGIHYSLDDGYPLGCPKRRAAARASNLGSRTKAISRPGHLHVRAGAHTSRTGGKESI
jgi:hypothetical protein